jgi:hypothetical protein
VYIFRNTELECGQLSSCSDSDESCSEEALDLVLNSSCTGERIGSAELMNDVDDETMSGDNDVSFVHHHAPQSLPPVSMSDLDSLTYTEPSMESLASLTTAARTPGQTSLTTSYPFTVATNLTLEDEMLLLRLMDLKGNPPQTTAGALVSNAAAASRLPLSSKAGGAANALGMRQLLRGVGPGNTQLIDSLQLDLGSANPFGLSSSQASSSKERILPDSGIAPLPSIGSSSKSCNLEETAATSLEYPASSSSGAGATVPLPSLVASPTAADRYFFCSHL